MSDRREDEAERRGRAGRRASQKDAEDQRTEPETAPGPLPEPEQHMTDRIDGIVGRVAAGEHVDAQTITRLLDDSGLTRADLDMRIDIARDRIATERRRAEAMTREAGKDAAQDVRAVAAEKAAALRREAERIEAEGRQEAAALLHELADEVTPAEGQTISEAIVQAAYDEWQSAKAVSQHARKRLDTGTRLLKENDRIARGHMQRKAQAYSRLKDALDRARAGK